MGIRQRGKGRIELVDADSREAEIVGILRFLTTHAGRYTGLMVIAELPDGSYEAKYTGTSNVAERLGRLEFLRDDIKDEAYED